ncbi:MAG: DUF2232 domain-containing protein [Telmatospirillum sp.]|nr:DUF2232 domain-containing protein [Telmatospirillum sp.]
MSKDIGLSVVAGLASALVLLSVSTGGGAGLLLAYLMPLPLVMIGFSRGLGLLLPGAIAALALVAAVSASAVPAFAVTALLPAVALVPLALRRQSGPGSLWSGSGDILAGLAATAAVAMVAGSLLFTGGEAGIEEQARAFVAQAFGQVAPQVAPEMQGSVIALWSALFPAMLGCAWLIMAVLNGVLAQWIVARAGQAMRPTPAYAGLDLPSWLALALVLAAVAGMTLGGSAGYLARNAAVVLILPQTLAGLAFVHKTLRGRPNGGLLLALFYVVFFVMFGWSLVAVAGLGLVRHWTRLRRRQVEGSQEEK